MASSSELSLGGKTPLEKACELSDKTPFSDDVRAELVGRLAIFGASYKSFEESLPPDLLKVFKEITPETIAPEALKEQYEKLSPAPNWIGLAAKILESMKSFQGFSPE